MALRTTPFHIDVASWPYVRFFTSENSSWQELEASDLAKDIWHAAIGPASAVGLVSIPLQRHAGEVKQLAETAPPVKWIVAQYTRGMVDEIYTFAEAKPWQVSHPDLFSDILRLHAGSSPANRMPEML